MKFKKMHWLGIIFSVIIIIINFSFFFNERIFLFLIGIAIVIVSLPFLISLIIESKIEKEKSEKFLEFMRNLSESVKTGTPIGKSIINMSSKDFGSLSPNIKKLSNQISLGIPISKSLENFADDVDNIVVRRAVSLIKEAENAGGEIDSILDSTAQSIYQIEKLKEERRAAISSLVVQGYIIFFIFIGIMLIMQFRILPIVSDLGGKINPFKDIGNIGNIEEGSTISDERSKEDIVKDLTRPFLYLLLIQGFFAGLIIGKISEGNIKHGIKHSMILVLTAFLISSGANAFVYLNLSN